MKTKIFVLHLKEVLYTSLFIILGIILLIVLVLLFMPSSSETVTTQGSSESEETARYQAGDYDISLNLGSDTITLRLRVSSQKIEDLSLQDLTEELKTLYPLLEPSLNDIKEQLLTSQDINEVVYPDERKYTSILLINAIKEGLQKASSSHAN